MFLTFKFGSPNLTIFTLPLGDFTYTANFFGPPDVLNGEFKLTFLPLYSASLIDSFVKPESSSLNSCQSFNPFVRIYSLTSDNELNPNLSMYSGFSLNVSKKLSTPAECNPISSSSDSSKNGMSNQTSSPALAWSPQ